MIELEVRAFRSEDYKTLTSWWKHWGHPVVTQDELPDTGYMVYCDGKPLFCGFLVLTNAKFAFVETICASPETSWEDREYLLSSLVTVISGVAKDLGFRRLIGVPQKERLAEKAQVAGFAVLTEKTFLCIKEL